MGRERDLRVYSGQPDRLPVRGAGIAERGWCARPVAVEGGGERGNGNGAGGLCRGEPGQLGAQAGARLRQDGSLNGLNKHKATIREWVRKMNAPIHPRKSR